MLGHEIREPLEAALAGGGERLVAGYPVQTSRLRDVAEEGPIQLSPFADSIFFHKVVITNKILK